MNTDIILTAFKVLNKPKLSQLFFDSHNDVLEKFGYKKYYATSEKYWMKRPNVYAIIAKNNKEEMIGGVRLELGSPEYTLPFERSIKNADNKLLSQIDKWIEDIGCAEICSLWISKKGIKSGLKSDHLILAAIGLMKQLNTNVVISISITSIGKNVRSIGGRRLSNFGDDGYFPFMTDRKVSIDHFKFPESLKDSDLKYKEALLKLFETNEYEFFEENGKRKYRVLFNLKL